MTKNIKLAAAVLALSAIFSSAAMAQPQQQRQQAQQQNISLAACSKSGREASIVLHVKGRPTRSFGGMIMYAENVHPREVFQRAWNRTVNPLTDDELRSKEGAKAFYKNMAMAAVLLELRQANGQIGSITNDPPVIGGPACKVK